MSTALHSIVQKAMVTAHRRKQRLSTAHLVLATYQSPHASVLFAPHGVDEARLMRACAREYEESDDAVTVALERAVELGDGPRDVRDGAMRLLAAILREPRSAGWQCLEHAGVTRPVVRNR